ncbi:hypothetical protein MMC17_004716 [Xylographa soralifera]|nr:hypothetical protein [Xylographa soralifera]
MKMLSQKIPKILAFPPIEAKFAVRVCGVSTAAEKLVNANVNGEDGDTGLSMESYEAMRSALSPSPELAEMNRQMIENIARSLDGLIAPAQQSTKIDLWNWLRRHVTAATTNAVYGPQNPFKDESVVDAFWQFEGQIMAILVGVLPSITARRGLAGRARVSKALEQYFKAGGHGTASILARNRYECMARNKLALEDIAKFEVGGAIAVLVNTVPAAFWMLFFVYSTPGLLDEVRRQVDAITVTNNSDGVLVRSIDITTLKRNCPLLISVFQETLRYRSVSTSVRQVMEDTVLDGQWLLKKDSMIQMPSRIIHRDSSLWGTDVEEFNPQRFLKSSEVKSSGSNSRKRRNPAAFRAFGGGTTLCPGRHFASNEVLAVTAMFVLRYDMVPTAGEWVMPSTENTNIAGGVMEPDTDIEVEVSARKGFEQGRFTCSLEDSDTILAVAAEDRTE